MKSGGPARRPSTKRLCCAQIVPASGDLEGPWREGAGGMAEAGPEAGMDGFEATWEGAAAGAEEQVGQSSPVSRSRRESESERSSKTCLRLDVFGRLLYRTCFLWPRDVVWRNCFYTVSYSDYY